MRMIADALPEFVGILDAFAADAFYRRGYSGLRAGKAHPQLSCAMTRRRQWKRLAAPRVHPAYRFVGRARLHHGRFGLRLRQAFERDFGDDAESPQRTRLQARNIEAG